MRLVRRVVIDYGDIDSNRSCARGNGMPIKFTRSAALVLIPFIKKLIDKNEISGRCYLLSIYILYFHLFLVFCYIFFDECISLLNMLSHFCSTS
jgi:hypothetical protein